MQCPAGFASYAGSTACSVCTQGRFLNASSSFCDLCTVGKYQDSDNNESSCYNCPNNQKTTSVGAISASQCNGCSEGFGFQGSSVSSCLPCDSGYFSNGSSICFGCSRGTFSDTSAQTVCHSCPSGKFSSSENSSSCTLCPKGKWSNSTAQSLESECNLCPVGKFGGYSGLTSCVSCGQGTYNVEQGRTTCTTCPASTGILCADGTINPSIDAGFWSDGESVFPCVPQIACPGGFLTSDSSGAKRSSGTPCSAGYTGTFCSSCDSDYFRLSGLCRKCLAVWARIIVVLIIAVLIIFLCWKLSLIQDRIPFHVKISFYWIQFISLYSQLSESWPKSLRALFGMSNFFNFEIQYFGFSCGTRISFWDIWIVKMSTPVLLGSALLGISFIRNRLKHSSISLVQILQHQGVNILYTITLLSTLIFGGVFQVFNCIEQGNGSFYLLSDPSIKCYDSEWKLYAAVDAFFILLYIALPSIMVLVLAIKYANNPGKKRELITIFCSPYREGCELWEFARIFYKIIFVVIRDVSIMDRATKTLVLLLVLSVQFYVEYRVSPFSNKITGQVSVR
jgi:hypothetical protein